MESTAWWEAYEMPDGDPIDWYDRDVRRNCHALACRYLTQRGMEVTDCDVKLENHVVDVIAREKDGTTVLCFVLSGVGEDPKALPPLEVDSYMRWHARECALRYLMDHSEVDNLRCDVLSVDLHTRTEARLRHLVELISWSE